MHSPSLTILIPCLNEEFGVASVVRDYAAPFPRADARENGHAPLMHGAEDRGRLLRTANPRDHIDRLAQILLQPEERAGRYHREAYHIQLRKFGAPAVRRPEPDYRAVAS